MKVTGKGTKASPWKLTTPAGTAGYEAYREQSSAREGEGDVNR